MTRRTAVLALAGAAALRAQARKLPSLLVSSAALPGVGYAEIGEIVAQLGFDGIDITVQRGGLVEPHLAPVDEVRALESVQGAGLTTPVITTDLYTPFDAWCRTVLALAGRTGVPLFRSALDQQTASPSTRRDAFTLAALGREYKIGLLVVAGCRGTRYSVAAARALVETLDPEWSGIALHAECFAPTDGVTDDQVRPVLPRVKAVVLPSDGTADLPRMFKLLAQAGFSGPVTLDGSANKESPTKLAHKADEIRKQMRAAYSGADSAT